MVFAACAPPSKAQAVDPTQPMLVTPTVIYRAFSIVDPAFASRGIGTLYVITRSADKPTQGIVVMGPANVPTMPPRAVATTCR